MADLTEFERSMPREQLEAVRACFARDLGPVTDIGGGSASPKVVLGHAPCRHLLKRRRREFSPRDVVLFDHGVMQYLASAGLPVVPPLLTESGESAVWVDGWAFEVFEFVEGLERFDAGDDGLLLESAELLGRFHRETAEFQPPGRKDWQREFHMGENVWTLQDTLENLSRPSDDERALAETMLAVSRRVAADLTDELYAQLPTAIIHGDYTWANLGCRGGHIAGLFDFDWTYRQARLDDVARAVLFLAFPRDGGPSDDDIWGLVAPWTLDMRRASLFLAAYQDAAGPFNDLECRLLPAYVKECWLCCRIRAMRKVDDTDKLRILTFGMAPILDAWDTLDGLA